ncbi:MAG: efflux RND transporter periplasmic adaptor subunit [Candidatus Pseudobacter hemicellulosilyticus]|uniref:Efflux RND transporter periplasmic adaptor subunit n=1 Tax=Candidatus Pseudobacter hemicellulosilyticus TaxID=3121375 RepID=A0AAJ6BGS4_9BACT|nr:MAG: efflux RND transporter periplasmic adaptor subunit [Pseudobacter sp.]
MNKVLRIVIAVVLIAGSFGLIAYVLSNNKKKSQEKTQVVSQTNATVSVRVDTVSKAAPNTDVLANGIFAPSQELSFSAEKAGRVVNVLVKEGNAVRKGQVLATIRVDQLSVDMQSAEAAYQTALADKERYENAFRTGGVTQQQLDQAKLNLSNAKAKLDQSRINLGDASIRATIDGIVNERYIEPGSVVAAGTKLFDIVNVSTLKLNVTVNEGQVAGLSVGKGVKVAASVFPGKSFAGKVTFIAPKADASLNFPVEIEISNNAANQLKAGMYGTAFFDFPNQAPVTIIPRTAFVGSVSSNQVFVVENGIARLKQVTPGRLFGDRVEVLEGLQDGNLVITSGQINLTDGTAVSIIK